MDMLMEKHFDIGLKPTRYLFRSVLGLSDLLTIDEFENQTYTGHNQQEENYADVEEPTQHANIIPVMPEAAEHSRKIRRSIALRLLPVKERGRTAPRRQAGET